MLVRNLLATLTISVLVTGVNANSALKNAVTGKVPLQSATVLNFGPDGLLLIGDGIGKQILAVDTGDSKKGNKLVSGLEKVDEKLAARLGTTPKGIEILDMAANPVSGKVYFAVRKQDTKAHVILTLDQQGQIQEFELDNVRHVQLKLPESNVKLGLITDVAWAGDRVLAAARANEAFASKIFVVPAPLVHGATAAIYSAETYHVQHRRWETKAPMSALIPYEEDGKKYVVGAFSCTPVVKYPVADIEPGAKVRGISVLEIGSGNRPLDMFTYEKDGKAYVLANTYRFHHEKRPFGPSPYWACRFERNILGATVEVNEKALRRLDDKGPATDRVQMVESFHGVTQMDKLGDANAVVIRMAGTNLNLEVLALP